MERIGDLTVKPRALSAKPGSTAPRLIDRLVSLLSSRRRKQPIALDGHEIYREHPALLFATDKEIVDYATRQRDYDRYRQVPLTSFRRI